MHYPKQYESAERLEQHLGDPLNPQSLISFATAVEQDEREEYPEESCAELNRWGLQRFYIPAHLGGEFTSYEELFALLRTVARRDLTTALVHVMTYVATIPVWVRGNEAQQRKYAKLLGDNERIAIALTEKAHGADVLSNEVEAVKVDGGFLLSGEKWLISNASRSSTITLFARTDERGGPRGFSLFVVEKKSVMASTFEHLPKIKTHGIRGADVGGIAFKNLPVGEDAMIGTAGGGLETTLKSFQVSRTLLPAPILGAADTGLRTTLKFALERRLYGSTVFAIPYVQAQLSAAFTDLLICDCVAIAATRMLHVAPQQMSLWSAVTKYLVPVRIEQQMSELAVVLGARHYLREGHCFGIFQKLLRESATLAAFHVGSYLNLTLIGQQQRSFAEHSAKHALRDRAEMKSRLASVFDLRAILPVFDPSLLELSNRGQDDLLESLPSALSQVQQLVEQGALEKEVAEDLPRLLDQLMAEVSGQRARVMARGEGYGNALMQKPEMFAEAKRHCALHGAGACVQMWLHNREHLGEFFAGGQWLVLALHRLLQALRPNQAMLPYSYFEKSAQEILRVYEANQMFSLVPFQLAGTSETGKAAFQ
jgi:alkylation response protein AidB-like acyl-CoA dehydrogenase